MYIILTCSNYYSLFYFRKLFSLHFLLLSSLFFAFLLDFFWLLFYYFYLFFYDFFDYFFFKNSKKIDKKYIVAYILTACWFLPFIKILKKIDKKYYLYTNFFKFFYNYQIIRFESKKWINLAFYILYSLVWLACIYLLLFSFITF